VQVCDYDLIGGGDPIGKIKLGWSQNKVSINVFSKDFFRTNSPLWSFSLGEGGYGTLI
jgi:hypothetical protein